MTRESPLLSDIAVAVTLNSDRAFAWLRRRRDSLRKIGLSIALLIFVVGLFLALRAEPTVLQQLRVSPVLLLLFAGLPSTVALNAAEFRVMMQMAGYSLPWLNAVEVTVYGSAANMLPLPGGVLVRVAVMQAHGATLHRGGGLIVLFAAMWGAAAFLYSGLALIWLERFSPGAAFILVSLVLFVVCAACLRFLSVKPKLTFVALFIRFASLLVEAARNMAALWAIGIDASFEQASALVIASFLGTAISIVPAGLGVSEGAVALLSSLVGIAPAAGFLAATINRLITMMGLGILSAALFIIHRKHNVDLDDAVTREEP